MPKDDATRCLNGPVAFYDNVAPLNVPPKQILQLKLHDGAWHTNGGLDFIWNTQIVYLTYCDEKGKEMNMANFNQRVSISKCYLDCFRGLCKMNISRDNSEFFSLIFSLYRLICGNIK